MSDQPESLDITDLRLEPWQEALISDEPVRLQFSSTRPRRLPPEAEALLDLLNDEAPR